MKNNINYPTWLTKNLQNKIRKVFEPRYKRILTIQEVIDIANSLATFSEIYTKLKLKQMYEER